MQVGGNDFLWEGKQITRLMWLAKDQTGMLSWLLGAPMWPKPTCMQKFYKSSCEWGGLITACSTYLILRPGTSQNRQYQPIQRGFEAGKPPVGQSGAQINRVHKHNSDGETQLLQQYIIYHLYKQITQREVCQYTFSLICTELRGFYTILNRYINSSSCNKGMEKIESAISPVKAV